MSMTTWHWVGMIAIILVAYYVGRHYPLNLPVLG